jgi:ABC-type nitrate/sulfonate/bicarbonate transport system permease component
VTAPEVGRLHGPNRALRPGAIASVRTAFAVSWTLVVVIETIAASRGIGAQMSRRFRVRDVSAGIARAGMFRS